MSHCPQCYQHDGKHIPECPGRKHSKYRNKITEVNGVKFASKKEAWHYGDLCIAKKSGELLYFLQQVPFHLAGGVRYICDFAEFWRNGEVRFVDTKGFRTQMYRLKKKLVEAQYPIKITEI